MFDAFSRKLNKPINISEATDLNDTFSSFANHPIAVLGQWQISRKYNIECEVTRPQNIIYKFANK